MVKKEIVIDGEIVYLKKDYFGWRTYDKPTKWHHYVFGSKKNLIMLIIIMFIALMLYIGINEVISGYKAIAANPCGYCVDCHANPSINMSNLKFNVST